VATLLHVDASPRTGSVTRALTATFVEAWAAANPGGTVLRHDLVEIDPPHLGPDQMNAWFLDPATWSAEQQAFMAMSERLIDELLAADVVVIGAPMWNFGIPSSLKAWIDHIVRAGRTIGFSDAGPVGLLPSPRVIVVTGRGSEYAGDSPMAVLDFQEPYLRTILGFVGAGEITFVHAERQGPSYPDGADVVLAARERLVELAAGPGIDIDLTAEERDQRV
jgi:FMN-dependent NADH-azoreductase